MSKSSSLAFVKTLPIPFGVNVEWRWPEGICLDSKMELQYLYSDGQLKKDFINWPMQSLSIGGLKAGERLQIRLRIVGKDGVTRDWHRSDWIEGVSSTNAGDYVSNICAILKVSADMTVKKKPIHRVAEEINNIANKTKHRLSDYMPEALRDAVREMLAKQVTASMPDNQVKDNDPVISTLAEVLGVVLPATPPEHAADVARQMAEAVKAGFGAMRPS